VTIKNDDQLCIATAIGVSWAKLNRRMEKIAKDRQKKSNLQLILEHQQVPESYYKNLVNKKRDEQKQLAVAINQLAEVPLDRPASLDDVEAFEKVLGCA
jgi:predicted metallo-beta-lactamase superfamily hydrolase